MKAYLINMHLLVPISRSSAKVKVKYKGYISQKMAISGAFVFHKYILFVQEDGKNSVGKGEKCCTMVISFFLFQPTISEIFYLRGHKNTRSSCKRLSHAKQRWGFFSTLSLINCLPNDKIFD